MDLYYNRSLSVPEIARELGVTIDAAYYFMRKHHLARRDKFEQNKVTFSKKRPSFKLKKNLNDEEEKLRIAGTMLYWAEGYKTAKATLVDFANSDPEMIIVFLSLLRDICGVNELKLRVYLYCYSNQNPSLLVNYWSTLTKISKAQFTKPYVRKDYDLSKVNKMKKGLIHIRYHDKKLLLLIMDWIEEHASSLRR